MRDTSGAVILNYVFALGLVMSAATTTRTVLAQSSQGSTAETTSNELKPSIDFVVRQIDGASLSTTVNAACAVVTGTNPLPPEEAGHVSRDASSVNAAQARLVRPEYKEDTHTDLTYQAFLMLTAGAMRDELAQYIGSVNALHDCNDLGSIVDGSWEEDCGANSINHFWDPDYGTGLLEPVAGESAYARASELYLLAKDLYSTGNLVDRQNAYYTLGRVAHLLEDVSQPAHVHLDSHSPLEPSDNYEELVNEIPSAYRWDTPPSFGDTASNVLIAQALGGYPLYPIQYAALSPEITVSGPKIYQANDPLTKLFLNLAETADYFESEDVAGDDDNVQYNQLPLAYTWHPRSSPPPNANPEFQLSHALLHANFLAPLAMRYVAGLYQAFWDETHPPVVTTGGATSVGQTTATLSAAVNPKGAATTLYFDYGKTTSYGLTATYGSVGLGTTEMTKSQTLTNLSCGSVYHYKARAGNAAVERSGADKTFTTFACTPSCYSVTPTANPTGGGTASVTTAQNCSGGYISGTSVAISALASNGYQFSGWTAANCTLANATATSTNCTMTGTGTATVSAQFTSTTSGESELIINGSFASGSTGWVRSGNLFADSRFAVCRSCPGYAYLSNSDGSAGSNLVGTLYQAVTIPSNATSTTLTFWYSIMTQEVTTTTAYDVLFVSIQDLTTGSPAEVVELSNLNSTSSYAKFTANLVGFAGHTVWLHFVGSTDGAKPTVFRIDDASVKVTTSSCTSFTISPSSRSAGPSSGSRTVTITGSPVGCEGGNWSGSGNGSWLTVSPASGNGSGSTVVSWAQNSSTASRSATALIAGKVFTVNQDGESATCTSFTLDPPSWNPSSAAGSQSVTVTGLPSGCQGGNWSTSESSSWLSVSPSSGSGSGSATVAWTQNTSTSSRSDNATIASRTFSVTQSGTTSLPCTSFTIAPSSMSPSSASGSQSVAVTGSPSGCQGGTWSTSESGSWLSVSPTSGSGSGSTTVTWTQNTSTSSRSDSATIASRTFSVAQSGSGGGGGGAPHPFVDVTGATVQGHDLDVGPDGSVYVLIPVSSPRSLKVVKSTDGGLSWGAPVSVPNSLYTNSYYDLAVDSGGTIHVTWSESANDQSYYSRSTNGGASFSSPISVRSGDTYGGYRTINSVDSSVAADGIGNVYVVYGANTRDGSGAFAGYNVWVSKSTNGGGSFQPEFFVGTISLDQKKPAMVRATASNLYVLYIDETNSDLYFYRRNVGAASGNVGRVNANPGSVLRRGDFVVAPDEMTFYATYSDTTDDSDGDVAFCKSTDGGITWQACTRVNDSTTHHWHEEPAAGMDSLGGLHAIWVDSRSNTDQTYYSHSADGGATFSVNVNISEPLIENKFTQPHLMIDNANSALYISATRDLGQVMVARRSVTPAHQEPPPMPTGLIASAVSSTRVDVVWTAAPGASSYQIDRRSSSGGYSQIGTTMSNTFSDVLASADSAYLYRVRAINEGGTSPSSSPDLATTVLFVDSALTPGVVAKAVHVAELRTAVNAVRLLAGLSAMSFTDVATSGTTIRAVHVAELRSSLDAARSALALSTAAYTNALLAGVVVKPIHIQELRDRVK
jgi:hypothetical protein